MLQCVYTLSLFAFTNFAWNADATPAWIAFARLQGASDLEVGIDTQDNWDPAGESSINMAGIKFCALTLYDSSNNRQITYDMQTKPSTWPSSGDVYEFDLDGTGSKVLFKGNRNCQANGCKAALQSCIGALTGCGGVGCCGSDTYGTRDEGGYTYNEGLYWGSGSTKDSNAIWEWHYLSTHEDNTCPASSPAFVANNSHYPTTTTTTTTSTTTTTTTTTPFCSAPSGILNAEIPACSEGFCTADELQAHGGGGGGGGHGGGGGGHGGGGYNQTHQSCVPMTHNQSCTAVCKSGYTSSVPSLACISGSLSPSAFACHKNSPRIPCMNDALVTHAKAMGSCAQNYLWCAKNPCTALSFEGQCSDVMENREYYSWATSLCTRVKETAVLNMKTTDCNGYKCPPCILVEGHTAVTIQNCGNNTLAGELFIANINNDGKTLVTVSDGEDMSTPDRILFAGESIYCQCNNANSHLSCAAYSKCAFALPQNHTCTAFMPGCRVTYEDQTGPTQKPFNGIEKIAPIPIRVNPDA